MKKSCFHPASLWLLGVLLLSPAAQGSLVRFDETQYTVNVGTKLPVLVHFDADEGQPGFQGWSKGLLGISFMVEFDPLHAMLGSEDDIVLPAVLNGDGAGGPPVKTITPASAGVVEAVGLDNTDGYRETLLATLWVQNTTVGTYTLRLNFFNTDPRMADFADIEGTSLDDQITFGSAAVTVVPEPASFGLLALGATLLALSRRLRSRPAKADVSGGGLQVRPSK